MSQPHRAAVRNAGALAAAVVLGSTALSACNSQASNAADDGVVSIAFLGYAATNGYTKSSYLAAKAAAEDAGATVTFFDGKFDGATQLAQLRDVIASGKYDAVEIMPNNSQQLAPVVQQALAKGISVAAIDYVIGTDPSNVKDAGVEGITVQIADDMAEGGKVQGEKAAELCEGIDPCKVLIAMGSKASEFDVIKIEKVKNVLNDHDNIEVVSEAELAFDEAKSEEVTRDVLQAHPDLNLIVTTGDQMCFGASRAAKAARITFSAETKAGGGKIACLGWGASRQGVAEISAGRWPSSIALVPETFGAVAAQELIKAVEDPDYKPMITTQSELSPVGRIVDKQVLSDHPDFKGEWDK